VQDIDKSNLGDAVINYNKLLVEASKQMLKSSQITARILRFHFQQLDESSQKLSLMFVDDRVVAPETKLIFR
jgi:ssRNA-specific RNase YbeY (16S rRNA maturation enzyme)